MHPSTILAALLPAAVMAQKGGSKTGGAVHIVKVGQSGLTFDPKDIKAAVGDKVEFHFYPMAHSVAQSAFEMPCMPMAMAAGNGTAKAGKGGKGTTKAAAAGGKNATMPAKGGKAASGFFSGPVKVATGVGAEVFTVDVKDTKPQWFYCATGKHCQGGMVGVINAPADKKKTVEMYAKAAAAATANIAPAAVGGGKLGAPAGGAAGGGSAMPSGGAAKPPTKSGTPGMPASAGVESYGSVRWGLLSAGMAAAGLVGGLLI